MTMTKNSQRDISGVSQGFFPKLEKGHRHLLILQICITDLNILNCQTAKDTRRT